MRHIPGIETVVRFSGRVLSGFRPVEDVDPAALSLLPPYRQATPSLFDGLHVPPVEYVPQSNYPQNQGDQLFGFMPAARPPERAHLFAGRFLQTASNRAFPTGTTLVFEWRDAEDGEVVCCNCLTKRRPDGPLRRAIVWLDANNFTLSHWFEKLHLRVHARETRTYVVGRMRGNDKHFYLEALEDGVSPIRQSSTVWLGQIGVLTNDRPTMANDELVIVEPLTGGAA